MKSWLLAPLLDLSELQARQDALEALVNDIATHGRLARKIAEIHDLE